jgi:hypothetical protein
MNRNKLFTVVCLAAAMAACTSGDINIDPSTVSGDTITNNSGGGGGSDPNAICASYVRSGQTIQGTADGNGNCTYGAAFVGPKNNLEEDLFIPALPNGGAHIFTTSLFVGNTYRTQAELAAAGIIKGGDGPTLVIEAGATLAFESKEDFLVINRGSQILADGTADKPITFTSVSDVNGTVTPEAVEEWGGIVIDGFAVTNKCAYVGTRGQPGFGLAGECSLDSEGSEGDDANQYGGANDDDDSGILRYVVVKHTGAEVGNGDELNGVSFAAVGRGTVVDYFEMYSMFDDGFEMFGGAVNINHYLGMYIRDDSIDIDEGYNGTVSNALVIQQQNDGDHCIESDGLGSWDQLDQATKDDMIARNLNSRPTIDHLTCILSMTASGTREDGISQGFRIREAIWPTIENTLVVTTFQAEEDPAQVNECIRMESPEVQNAALNGDMKLQSVIFACQDPGTGNTPFGGFTDEADWAASTGTVQFATVGSGATDPTANGDTELQLLGGTLPVYSLPWATSMVDGAAPIAGTAPTDGGDYLGAIPLSAEGTTDDWTVGWTYGLHPENRGEPLWFE